MSGHQHAIWAASHRVALVAAWAQHYADPQFCGEPHEANPSPIVFDGCISCIIREAVEGAYPAITQSVLHDRAVAACLN